MMHGGWQSFLALGLFAIMLFIAGLYCVVMTRNTMRMLIGLGVMTKGATLLLIAAGYAIGREGLAQAMVITLIVIEVVVVAVAAGVILSIYRTSGSLDARDLKELKG